MTARVAPEMLKTVAFYQLQLPKDLQLDEET